jgi:hypothetical protein
MAEEDDFLTLIEDEQGEIEAAPSAGWKIAVIDDDPAVHDGTRFALYDYTSCSTSSWRPRAPASSSSTSSAPS